MPEHILACPTIARGQTELRECPFPEVPADAGLLKIEAAGVCGSEWITYNADRPARIMGYENVGHENVGRIHRIGSLATEPRVLKKGHLAVRSPVCESVAGAIHVTVIP